MKRVFFLLMIPMLLIAQGSGLFIQELNDGRFLLRNSLPPRNVTEEVYELDVDCPEEVYEKVLSGPSRIDDNGMNGAVITLSFIEGLGWIVSTPFWSTVGAPAAIGTALGYLLYKGYTYYIEGSYTAPDDFPIDLDGLEWDSSKCPGEGFEWRGSGDPESGKGNWVRGDNPDLEKLYPDFDHEGDIPPHWDYNGPRYPDGVRIFPDKIIQPKKKK